MGQTALQLVQAACYEANIPAPSALVGSTDTSVLQLLHLFYATGRELLTSKCWDQLKRKHFVILEDQRRLYQLPPDFYTLLPFTAYDSRTSWATNHSQSDIHHNAVRYGLGTSNLRVGFRVLGAENQSDGGGQIELDTVPTVTSGGEVITFEYITKSWLSPPLWSPSETVAQNTWRFSRNVNYKKTDVGSESGGTVAPDMRQGIGTVGSAVLRALSVAVWGATTAYAGGDYVTNGAQTYRCVAGGVSGATGPVETAAGVEETDGTCTWVLVGYSSINYEMAISTGDYVSGGSQLYICLEGGNTGKLGVQFNTTTVSDGSITWTPQTSTYDSLVTDSDLCLFDGNLMIAGLKWRFLRARGLAYEDLLAEYERMKDAAASRYNPGKILRLGGGLGGGLRYPTIPDGNFNV